MEWLERHRQRTAFSTVNGWRYVLVKGLDIDLLDGPAPDFFSILEIEPDGFGMKVECGAIG
jgi:hypothetical protein